MNFPVIQAPSTIEATTIKKVLRTTNEDGKPSVRPLWTTSKKAFTLEWHSLPQADYLILDSFFTENQGVEFTYTNHLTGTEYNVIFSEDELNASTQNIFDDQGKNCMGVSVKIQEV